MKVILVACETLICLIIQFLTSQVAQAKFVALTGGDDSSCILYLCFINNLVRNFCLKATPFHNYRVKLS